MATEKPVIVSIVVDHPLGPASRHGLNKLRQALQAKGVSFAEAETLSTANARMLLVAGTEGSPSVRRLLQSLRLSAPTARESLTIHHTSWEGVSALLVAGGDDRGLMYALLDVADRVAWAENPEQPLPLHPFPHHLWVGGKAAHGHSL